MNEKQQSPGRVMGLAASLQTSILSPADKQGCRRSRRGNSSLRFLSPSCSLALTAIYPEAEGFGRNPGKHQMQGEGTPWEGGVSCTPPFPVRLWGAAGDASPTGSGPAHCAQGCPLPSSATCFLDLLFFPSLPHSRSPLEPTVISTFPSIRFRRLEKAPG